MNNGAKALIWFFTLVTVVVLVTSPAHVWIPLVVAGLWIIWGISVG